MSLKQCAYKNCKNSKELKSDITLFRFPPKNPERIIKWKELCGLSIESQPKFICSEHFEDKYIAVSPMGVRRLLSVALPIPYSTPNDDNTKFETYEVEIEQDNAKNNECEIKIIHKSNLNYRSEYASSHGSMQIQRTSKLTDIEKNFKIYKKEENNKILIEDIEGKSKSEQKVCEKTFATRRKLEIDCQAVESVNSNNEKRLRCDEEFANGELISFETTENFLKQNSINSFFYKNEEYIQMPKKLFVEDRNSFFKYLNYYKKSLLLIKKITDKI